MRAGNSNFKCKQNTIISELTKQYGFETKQSSGGIRFLRLLRQKYDSLMSANVAETETAELEDSIMSSAYD
jgi:hypothetical protein